MGKKRQNKPDNTERDRLQSIADDMLAGIQEFKQAEDSFMEMLRENRERREAMADDPYDQPLFIDNEGLNLEARVLMSKVKTHTTAIYAVFDKHMDRMKELDISFLLALLLGHIDTAYKRIDKLYNEDKELYDSVVFEPDICYNRMTVLGIIYFRKVYAILKTKPLHPRVLSMYRHVLRKDAMEINNVEDSMMFSDMLTDNFVPELIKLQNCMYHYINHLINAELDTLTPTEHMIIYYLAMWDLIIRNGLTTENRILEKVRQEADDEVDVVFDAITNRSGPLRRNLTDILKAARGHELFITTDIIFEERVTSLMGALLDRMDEHDAKEVAMQLAVDCIELMEERNKETAIYIAHNPTLSCAEDSSDEHDERIATLEAELKQERASSRTARDEKAALERQLAEAEKRIRSKDAELRQLRSDIDKIACDEEELESLRRMFLMDDDEPEERVSEEDIDLSKLKIAIVGGHPNWINKYRALHPSWSYFYTEKPRLSLESIVNADHVVFVSSHISHILYNRVIDMCRSNGIKPLYINSSQELGKCDSDIKRAIRSVYN